MKTIKSILTLVSGFLCYIHGYAQADSVYAQIKDYKPANFKDVYIPDHKFVNPTIDFNNMVDDFVPEAKAPLPNQYENHTWKGKIKKITKYRKHSKETEKRISEIHFFNREGFLTEMNFLVTTNVYFHYDNRNRLIRKEAIRDSDTLNMRQYTYNDKNQITGYTESFFEKGKRRDSRWEVVYDPGNRSILMNAPQPDGKSILIKKYIYDGNKVKTENYADGALLPDTGHEFVYSENNNMISRKSKEYNNFFSYDQYNRKTREVSIMPGKTWDVQTKTYDRNGYVIRSSYENPVNKTSGSMSYKYDRTGNKVYETSIPDSNGNFYESFYEIEYY